MCNLYSFAPLISFSKSSVRLPCNNQQHVVVAIVVVVVELSSLQFPCTWSYVKRRTSWVIIVRFWISIALALSLSLYLSIYLSVCIWVLNTYNSSLECVTWGCGPYKRPLTSPLGPGAQASNKAYCLLALIHTHPSLLIRNSKLMFVIIRMYKVS